MRPNTKVLSGYLHIGNMIVTRRRINSIISCLTALSSAVPFLSYRILDLLQPPYYRASNIARTPCSRSLQSVAKPHVRAQLNSTHSLAASGLVVPHLHVPNQHVFLDRIWPRRGNQPPTRNVWRLKPKGSIREDLL